MPFVPRTSNEIRMAIVARIRSTTTAPKKLNDIAQGGRLSTLAGEFANELAVLERRAYDMTQAHGFGPEVVGEDLYDRVAQLPLSFPPPRGSAAARGGNLTLIRTTTGTVLSIPIGGLRVGRTDNPNLEYTNTDAISIGIGFTTASGINLVCKTPGADGNCPAGAVNSLITIPDNVVSAVTTSAMSGGTDGETDEDVRRRANLWLSSLARSQPTAIESICVNFESSTGQRVLYAKVVEDPAYPAYSVCILDDGFGMVGYTRAATTRTGTVPTLVTGARYTFTFDFPAVQEPSLTITKASTGVTTTYLPGPDWIALRERGVLWTNSTLTVVDLEPGDTWSIGGHDVYTDIFVELQAYVEATCRAAGTRVVLVPAIPIYVSLTGVVVAKPGYNLQDLITRVVSSIVAYFTTLGLGEPLFMHDLHAALSVVEGLENIIFDQGDRYAGSFFYRLTTLPGLCIFR